MATDVYSGNIIFGNNLFTLIDTQCYEYSSRSDLENLNINIIIKEIYLRLFSNPTLKRYLLLDSQFKNYLYDSYLLSNPSELIDGLINEILSKYGIQIDYLQSMKRVISINSTRKMSKN